jgi:hypothetical protein
VAVDTILMLVVVPMLYVMPASLKENTRGPASRALASIN